MGWWQSQKLGQRTRKRGFDEGHPKFSPFNCVIHRLGLWGDAEGVRGCVSLGFYVDGPGIGIEGVRVISQPKQISETRHALHGHNGLASAQVALSENFAHGSCFDGRAGR